MANDVDNRIVQEAYGSRAGCQNHGLILGTLNGGAVSKEEPKRKQLDKDHILALNRAGLQMKVAQALHTRSSNDLHIAAQILSHSRLKPKPQTLHPLLCRVCACAAGLIRYQQYGALEDLQEAHKVV